MIHKSHLGRFIWPTTSYYTMSVVGGEKCSMRAAAVEKEGERHSSGDEAVIRAGYGIQGNATTHGSRTFVKARTRKLAFTAHYVINAR